MESQLSRWVRAVIALAEAEAIVVGFGRWVGEQEKKQTSISHSLEGGAKWLTNKVNKIKGKTQKPLAELLQEYDLPIGLFPREATNYEFNEQTGRLTVHIPATCEVNYRDGSMLRFFTTVTGNLEKGKLSEMEGMKTKVVLIWLKVTCISTEGPNVIFTAGLWRTRSRDAYKVVKDGIVVDNF